MNPMCAPANVLIGLIQNLGRGSASILLKVASHRSACVLLVRYDVSRVFRFPSSGVPVAKGQLRS